MRRTCADPHCSKLVEGKGRYCEEHKKPSQPYYRDPEMQRFYESARWRRVRQLKLNKNPLCEICLLKGQVTPAQMVHHILPVKRMMEDALDMTYLVSLCNPHHNQVESEKEIGEVE